MGIRSRLTLWRRFRMLPGYLKDPKVAILKKIAVVTAAAYIIIPFDTVPDMIPILGWLDDLGVFGMLGIYMARELRLYGERQDDIGPTN